MGSMEQVHEVDALIVGAGMGGIAALRRLTSELGLDAVIIDKAAGVGGTWYWNRYPGALSDTQSFMYQLPFEKDLYQITDWTTRYVTSPEIRQYLETAVDFWGLRSRLRLETEMRSAIFDETGRNLAGRDQQGHLPRAVPDQLPGAAVPHEHPRHPGHRLFPGPDRAHRRLA